MSMSTLTIPVPSFLAPELTPFYKDVHKSTTDVFTQGFVGKSSLKFTTDTKAGDFAVKSVVARAVGKDKKTNQAKEVVYGTFEPTFEWREYNLQVDAKLSTQNDFTATVTHRPSFLANSKVGVGFNTVTNDKKENRVTILPVLDYQHEKFAFSLGANLSYTGGPHEATVNLNLQPARAVFVGGAVTAKVVDGGAKFKSGEVKVAGSFSDVNFRVGASYEKCDRGAKKGFLTPRVNYGLLYNLSDNLTVASQGSFDTSRSGGVGPTVAFGALYKVDNNLSFSDKVEFGFKSKDEEDKIKPTSIRLVVGSTTKVNTNLSASVGLDVNVRALLGAGEADHTCGVEFKFKQ